MRIQPAIIGFDADDTLFVNETYFLEAENMFCDLMLPFAEQLESAKMVFQTQIDNLSKYGYGIKGYILSMMEAGLTLSKHQLTPKQMEQIILIGKNLINKPILLLDQVEATLEILSKKYKLVVVTKGDLKDQHRKLHLSGLGKYFHHIEVLSDKQPIDYEKLLQRLEIEPKDFLMVGNSLKSDVLPVLEIGGNAIHIPFHTTWLHEQIDFELTHDKFRVLRNIAEVKDFLV